MALLVFKASDVKRIVEHSIASKQREIAKWETATEANDYTPKRVIPKEPHVVFVHDDGVYLMSNGTPRDLVGPDATDRIVPVKDEGRSHLAYAEGCNPKVDADWYDTARQRVGGDDFAEYLPWAKDMLDAINDGASEIIIEIGPNRLELRSR